MLFGASLGWLQFGRRTESRPQHKLRAEKPWHATGSGLLNPLSFPTKFSQGPNNLSTMQFTLLLALILTAIPGLNAQDCSFFPAPTPLPTPAPPGLTGPGNFAASCFGTFLSDPANGVLSTECRAEGINPDGCNSVFIGQCVGVQQPSGNMVCEVNGGAGINGTCTFDEFLQDSGLQTLLTGHCGNIEGGVTTSQIDLNVCFENLNGFLAC
ncbi:hypothetical protein MSAN_00476800 [Mycena sanguinolenta]|uniref:Cyanovirin-N domain-containing protein n=1 Tax=Mycena sanguinolenta TaxID=230812 RepID=A0A8H7DFR1_9AGAR|nr:hypothetical protein MSAN_00476800 [Mycena sanguinolenta]